MPVDIGLLLFQKVYINLEDLILKFQNQQKILISVKETRTKFHSIGYVFPRRKGTAKRSI